MPPSYQSARILTDGQDPCVRRTTAAAPSHGQSAMSDHHRRLVSDPCAPPRTGAAPADPCTGCGVRGRALCGGLDDDGLSALAALCQRRRVPAGETLMWAGDESLICAHLLSGVLTMVAATADGREQIVALFHPADFVGQPYASEVDFSVTALTDAELCIVPRRAFARFLESHAGLERLLLRRTLAALTQARARMLALARMSATERVAGLLLDVAARAGRDGGTAFDLPMTRGQMADVLGMTIETVSRQLTKLKGAGVIALSGARTVTIRDARALEERASGRATAA